MASALEVGVASLRDSGTAGAYYTRIFLVTSGDLSGDLRLRRRRDDSTAAIISMQSSRPCAVHVLIIAICDFSLGNSHNSVFID